MEIREHNGKIISDAKAITRIISAILATEGEIDREKEHFFAIGLNRKNCIKYIDLVSLGSQSAAVIHARETYRFAVMKGIDALIVAHNHPSGDPEPSEDDLAITRRLANAGDILGIKLLDHVIVGNETGKFFSMTVAGYLTGRGRE